MTKRAGHWILQSIEQGAEGSHALNEDLVATPWDDEQSLKDEALVEQAVGDAVPSGTKIAEVADLDFDGDARAAATTSASPTAASRPTCSRSPRAAPYRRGRRRSTAPTPS